MLVERCVWLKGKVIFRDVFDTNGPISKAEFCETFTRDFARVFPELNLEDLGVTETWKPKEDDDKW